MKILFIHNKYGKRSGEEIMLERIIALLRDQGHSVRTHFADSADIQGLGGKLHAAASGIRSVSGRRSVRDLLAEDRPDLVQVQNLFPLISPAVLPVIRAAGVPIVMRLSNYRLVCPNGLFLSHGKVCQACSGGREWHCITRNCESSLFKSTAYALRNAWARKAGYYHNTITRYYAQTAFQRDVLAREGYPADRIDVIPNMIDVPEAAPAWSKGAYVGFVGRLSAEKGVETLIEAARRLPHIPFRFAGNPGPWADRTDLPDNVALLGNLGPAELDAFNKGASLIAVPSLWYEGFPGVIIEAMRHSRPVVVSDIGGLPEIIEPDVSGLTCPPGAAEPLADAIAGLWADPDRRRRMGEAGFARVQGRYSTARYYDRLMTTYQKALA